MKKVVWFCALIVSLGLVACGGTSQPSTAPAPVPTLRSWKGFADLSPGSPSSQPQEATKVVTDTVDTPNRVIVLPVSGPTPTETPSAEEESPTQIVINERKWENFPLLIKKGERKFNVFVNLKSRLTTASDQVKRVLADSKVPLNKFLVRIVVPPLCGRGVEMPGFRTINYDMDPYPLGTTYVYAVIQSGGCEMGSSVYSQVEIAPIYKEEMNLYGDFFVLDDAWWTK